MANTEDELWLQDLEQPAIPFHKEEDNEAKTTPEKDESLYSQVNTSLANNQAVARDILKKDLCSHSILKYQGGTPEQYCKWRQAMKNLFIWYSKQLKQLWLEEWDEEIQATRNKRRNE